MQAEQLHVSAAKQNLHTGKTHLRVAAASQDSSRCVAGEAILKLY
jgi:hypothetical protein